MKDLTLVVPTKKEKESLPSVLEELKKYNLRIIIVLDKDDIETIQSISGFQHEILFQKNKGYGAALIEGINHVKTKFFCIFNADGSFDPKELDFMMHKIRKNNADFIFATRYEKNCSSEDDTILTSIGNYIFTKIGNIFFKLEITDILYTFVLGSTDAFKKLNILSNDFSFCIELPIKANRLKFKSLTSKSNERARIGGKKKVNAFLDGMLILISMIKLFFKK